jgi:phage FluMu protein Com
MGGMPQTTNPAGSQQKVWMCEKCGAIVATGDEAPTHIKKCPKCDATIWYYRDEKGEKTTGSVFNGAMRITITVIVVLAILVGVIVAVVISSNGKSKKKRRAKRRSLDDDYYARSRSRY